MGNLGGIPGEKSEPIESRRATVPDDPAQVAPEDAGAESAVDMPDMGELSPESARPTPLDEIAEAERENAPLD